MKFYLNIRRNKGQTFSKGNIPHNNFKIFNLQYQANYIEINVAMSVLKTKDFILFFYIHFSSTFQKVIWQKLALVLTYNWIKVLHLF
jgi:hypothetical protein